MSALPQETAGPCLMDLKGGKVRGFPNPPWEPKVRRGLDKSVRVHSQREGWNQGWIKTLLFTCRA